MNKKTDSSLYTSSEDSAGEDLSFQESIAESDEDLLYKKDRYLNIKKSIYKNKVKQEEDTSFSLWTSIFYTFFNNQAQDSITLNEFELRCKLLQNDQNESNNSNSSSSSTLNKQFEPLTNVKDFIQRFSEKRKENIFKKLFKKPFKTVSFSRDRNHSKTERNDFLRSNCQGQRTQLPHNHFLTILNRSILLTSTRASDSAKKSLPSMESYQVKENPKVIQRPSSLLSAYDIKDSQEILFSNSLKSLTKNDCKLSRNAKRHNSTSSQPKSSVITVQDIEYLNNLLSNKFAYQVELEKLMKGLPQSVPVKSIIHLLDSWDIEKFFQYHKGEQLMNKYGASLDGPERYSKEANLLCQRLIEKLNINEKLEI